MPFVEAAECVAKHKKLRAVTYKLVVIPILALAVWAIAIAAHYTWDVERIVMISALMVVGIVYGVTRDRRLISDMDDVLNKIRVLRK